MQSNQSPGRLFVLLTVAFLLGIGCSGAVYWLFVVPENRDQLSDTVAPSSSIVDDSSTHGQSSQTETSSSSALQKFSIRSLDDIAAIKSTSEQQLALRIFLSDLDEHQVAELMSQPPDVFPQADKYALRLAILQQLTHQNPGRALSLVLEMSGSFNTDYFVASVFKDWAHSNLDEAVSRARTLNGYHKRIALDAIMQERPELADNTIRAIARDLDNEQIAMSAIAQRKIQEAIGDPEKAWNEGAIHLQGDTANAESIARVAKAWVEKSGLSVLDQIQLSLTNAETKYRVIRSVLREVAKTEPSDAFNYALTIGNDQDNRIVQHVVSVWAVSDPRSALSAAIGVGETSARKAAAGSTIRIWARSRPKEVLESIDALPADLQWIASVAALNELSSTPPQETADLVAAMKSGSVKTSSARSIVDRWLRSDHNAVLEWILNEPGVEEIRSELLSSIMHDLVRVDPELAMTTARAQPIVENRIGFGMFGAELGMEFTVISGLAYSDVDKAIELLPQVRGGLTKLMSLQSVAHSLLRHDEIDKAFDTAQQFPQLLRQKYFSAMATVWVKFDPKGLFNSLARFPTRSAKSRAAYLLVSSNQYVKNLTDEEVDEARRHLSDEHAQSLAEGDSEVLRSMFFEY